ncbi:MAG TPA: SPOR domain-containing protein [Stellaceae bacterium]|nr:SPOR domain-containing protein [Stellaceae bacterium]
MAYLQPLGAPQGSRVPYRRIKRRGNRGLAIALALAVMALCAGAVWVAYELKRAPEAGAHAPLIQADNQPVKVKPGDPGGMEIPNRDRLVFNQKGDSTAEHVLAPPEAPMPRPAPQPAATPPPPQTQSSAVPPPPAQAPAPPAAPAPSAITGAPSTPAPASPGEARATPAPSPPQQSAAVPPPAPTPTSGKGFRLQVASVKTEDGAKQEWERIRRQNTDLLGALSYKAERVDLGERGVFFRVQIGPIADGSEAERICGALRSRNVGCILVKP